MYLTVPNAILVIFYCQSNEMRYNVDSNDFFVNTSFHTCCICNVDDSLDGSSYAY